MDLDLEISVISGYESEIEDFVDTVRREEVRVELTVRPADGPYAFFEWLIPSAIILFFVKPYAQEFSKELGKLHANALHDGLSKLWQRVLGTKPTVRYTLVGSPGKVGDPVFVATVSAVGRRKDGGEIKLLFAPDTSEEEFELAIQGFVALLNQHYASSGASDALTAAMRTVPYVSGPGWTLLVHRNRLSGKMEIVDYKESSMQGTLVTHSIEAPEV